MRIPKQFTLGGINWQVVQNHPVPNAMGACFVEEAKILLDTDLSRQIKEQTFCHELVHAILFAMGQTAHDEVFVDAFGAYLHQYLNTNK